MPEITKRLDRAEIGKRVERAEKLLQKGKTADALEEYLLVLRDDGDNDVVRQLSADLCLSLNRNADAVKLLGDLFERQVGTGDATRASLTYKKLARHGSPTWQQKFRFGQLLEGSNKKLAVGTYEAALSDLGKLGKKTEAAETLVWKLFEQNPARVQQVIALIGSLLDSEQEDAAVALARKLEQFQRRRGERRQFIAIMEDITAARRASPQMLEFLSELYNASNRENDYCQTLLKLFDLYANTGEYAKAAECLDRAAEVDPYESGHLKRLDMLKGRVEDARFRAIASRFTSASKAPEEPAHEEGPTLGA